jgi:large subunit ribosomal protein L23
MIKVIDLDILVVPIFTEKATFLNGLGKYTFKVTKSASKQQVKEAVERVFSTKVVAVNISNTKGKAKVFKGIKGARSGFKKAIVTLEKGKTLDFSAGVQ